MLKFPSIPERRSNVSSSYLSHLTFSPGFSPSHSNQSSPRYGLSPFTSSQQPRRFSLHVALRKTSDGQQATQTNLEENQDYHAFCKSANIKQDDTGDSHIIQRMPYIPSNIAFNLDSFIKSSEGKTVNTLSMTKGISEFDASLPVEDSNKRKTNEFKSKGISIFAPKKQGTSSKKHLDQKHSKESLTSLLNSSFEKELDGLNSPQSSEQEKNNTANKFSMASVEEAQEVQASNKASKEDSSIIQVPLARMMRRRSCCCSDCGHLSAFEKKHQNLTNPSKREEIHLIANENARRMLRLAQKKLATADSSMLEDHSTKEEKNEEGENAERRRKSTMQTENLFLHTEGFSNELQTLETPLSPPIATDMDYETTDSVNKDYQRKTSNPLKASKSRSQARRHQTSHSPKNFIVKHTKTNSLYTYNTRSEATHSPTSKPFSGVNARKGTHNTTASFFSKADSPTMMTEPQADLILGLQHKLQKLELKGRVGSIEGEDQRKIKMEKMKTLNDSTLFLKKGFDLTSKSSIKIDSPPPTRSVLPALKPTQGSLTPKKLTLGKQSIQSVYKNSSGNSTPKVLSVQQSPVNKGAEPLNFGKDSPKPRICIITSPNLELNRRGSGTGYRLLGEREPCVTTLETIDIFSSSKSKKDSLAMTLQEENDEEEMEKEEGADKEKKRMQRKKKKQQSQQPEKRSLSMGMLLKAYQGSQGKGLVQTKKSSGL